MLLVPLLSRTRPTQGLGTECGCRPSQLRWSHEFSCSGSRASTFFKKVSEQSRWWVGALRPPTTLYRPNRRAENHPHFLEFNSLSFALGFMSIGPLISEIWRKVEGKVICRRQSPLAVKGLIKKNFFFKIWFFGYQRCQESSPEPLECIFAESHFFLLTLSPPN